MLQQRHVTLGKQEYAVADLHRAGFEQRNAIRAVLEPLSQPQRPDEPLPDYVTRMADHVAEQRAYELLEVMLLPAGSFEWRWTPSMPAAMRKSIARKSPEAVRAAARECALAVMGTILVAMAQVNSVYVPPAAPGRTRFAVRYGIPTLTIDGTHHTIATPARASREQMQAIRQALQPLGVHPLAGESTRDHMLRQAEQVIACGAAVPLLAAVLVPVPPDVDPDTVDMLGDDFTFPGWSPALATSTTALLTTLTGPTDIAALHACARLAVFGVYEAYELTELALASRTAGDDGAPPVSH